VKTDSEWRRFPVMVAGSCIIFLGIVMEWRYVVFAGSAVGLWGFFLVIRDDLRSKKREEP
jgi:hypothetical protein